MKAEAPSSSVRPAVVSESHAAGPRLLKLRIAFIAVAWAISYGVSFASSRTGTAWLNLAEWGVSHGLGSLERCSEYVTLIVTCLSVVGAVLRVASSRERAPVRNLGLWAVCAPWGVLLPAASAGFYELTVAVASLAGLSAHALPINAACPSGWRRVLRESFPVMSALCFLTMSRQYNAMRLVQGLLIAAGVSLLVQAALPGQVKIHSQLPEDPAAASLRSK